MNSNPRIEYRLSSNAPKLSAPGGRPIIVHVIVNLEYWPFDKRMPRVLGSSPHGITPKPDVLNFSWYEYGMRCGMPRFLRALGDRGLKASCAINAGVIDVYPECAAAVAESEWELIGHCYEQCALTRETEADVISRTVKRISQFTGQSVNGWLGSGLVETDATPELLFSEGVRYVCDWGLDDLPVNLKTEQGHLVAMPSSCALDDGLVFGIETRPSDEMYTRLNSTLRVFEQEALENPRIITIGLHPHLMGEPHRFYFLERMLDELTVRDDTVFMTGTEILNWFERQSLHGDGG